MHTEFHDGSTKALPYGILIVHFLYSNITHITITEDFLEWMNRRPGLK